MFLNIILTLLVLTLVTITIMLYIWWKKYGKPMFENLMSMRNSLPKMGKSNMAMDLTQLMSELNKVSNQFKK